MLQLSIRNFQTSKACPYLVPLIRTSPRSSSFVVSLPPLGLGVLLRLSRDLWLTCSSIIYVVAPVRRLDEPWSEFEINWREVAARLGARLELASYPVENASHFPRSITDKADGLLALIKSPDLNANISGFFGSRSVIDTTRTPLILAGHGIGGIIIKRVRMLRDRPTPNLPLTLSDDFEHPSADK